MRKLAFLMFFLGAIACHQPTPAVKKSEKEEAETTYLTNGGILILNGDTADTSYREKEYHDAKQHVLNDSTAIRWDIDTVDNIAYEIYIKGDEVGPLSDTLLSNQDEVVKAMGEEDLLVIVNKEPVKFKEKIDNLSQMTTGTVGTFKFNDKQYLLFKLDFAGCCVSVPIYNLLIEVGSGRNWVSYTMGNVPFKELIDSIK